MSFEQPQDNENINDNIQEGENSHEIKEKGPIELIIQYGGYPCEAVVWVAGDIGGRNWRASASVGQEAIQMALKDLGVESAHVIRLDDTGNPKEDSVPDEDLGIITLKKEEE